MFIRCTSCTDNVLNICMGTKEREKIKKDPNSLFWQVARLHYLIISKHIVPTLVIGSNLHYTNMTHKLYTTLTLILT